MFNNLVLVLLSWYPTYTSQQTGKVCPISSRTLRHVTSCPEWKEAERFKICSLIVQNCTTQENFQYHCLINSFKNATLEVCAPSLKMNGYCPAFNEKQHRIESMTERDCSNSTSKRCPLQYLSTEAFRYPICFELQNIPSPSKIQDEISTVDAYNGRYKDEELQNIPSPSTSKNQDEISTVDAYNGRYKDEEQEASDKDIVWKIVCIFALFVIFVLVSVLIWEKSKRCRKSDSHKTGYNQNGSKEESMGLMENGIEQKSTEEENQDENMARGVEQKSTEEENQDKNMARGVEHKTTEEKRAEKQMLIERDVYNGPRVISREMLQRQGTIFASVNIGAIQTKYGFVNIENCSGKMPDIDVFVEPSILLLNSMEEFEAFGKKASEIFLELDEPDSENVHFFRNFMNISTIHNMKRSDEKSMSTHKGKDIEMLRIIEITTSHVKKRMLDHIAVKYPGQDIFRWIFSVPGTWNENARHLFKTAVGQAGIKDCRICNEHEAVKWYLEKQSSHVDEKNQLFVDLGGATTKIYALSNGKNISSKIIPDSGGILLLKGLTKCMQSVFSQIIYEAYKMKYRKESAELNQAFIDAMLRHKLNSAETERFCIEELISLFQIQSDTKNITDSRSKLPGICLQGSNFEISHQGILYLFDPLKRNISEGVENLLKTLPTNTNMAVYVFGGLSESEILFENMKMLLKGKPCSNIQKVKNPQEAIITGAILKLNEDQR